jgi:hypothetical protein
MEDITMIIETLVTAGGATIHRLRLGECEMPTEGQTIARCLTDMQQQGWQVAHAKACPRPDGVNVTYQFRRKPAEAIQMG